MPFALPISPVQFWLFDILSLVFFALVVRAMIRRPRERGGRRDSRSRIGILLQSGGVAIAAFGPVRPILGWLGGPAIAGDSAVLLLMGAAVALFAWSSNTLGKNWSLEARTLENHDLVRHGPYAHVRHPIYLAMLLFLLGLAVSLGHWLQLVLAIPLFMAGTSLRTGAEEKLLEESFGDAFRDYRRSTPAIIPTII